MKSMTRVFHHSLRVIYGDTDMMGVVYYANYLRYFEAARTEVLREQDLSYREFEETGYAMPVAEASVRYHASATYDDLLHVETRIDKIGGSSIVLSYRIIRDSDKVELCTGMTRHACVDQSGKVVKWPSWFKEKLNGS